MDLPSNQEIKEAEGAANLAKRAFGLEEKSEKEADKAESAEVATAGFSSSLHDADTITALKAPPVVEEDEFKKPKTPPEVHLFGYFYFVRSYYLSMSFFYLILIILFNFC